MSYGAPATTKDFNDTLIKLCRECPDDHMILELGSGHTSKIIYENRGKSPYIALENSEQWYKDIIAKAPHLEEHVVLSPLVPIFDGFSLWYDLSVCESRIKDIGLIIMDGPVGTKRVPGPILLFPYLADQYALIADDLFRKSYEGFLKGWSDFHKISLELHGEDFAVLKNYK